MNEQKPYLEPWLRQARGLSILTEPEEETSESTYQGNSVVLKEKEGYLHSC